MDNTTRNERSLRTGLRLGFALILLLLVANSLLGLYRLDESNRRLEQLVAVPIAKIELVQEMKNALRERALIMHTIALTSDPFDQDEEFQKFNILGVGFSSARTRLERLVLSDREQKVLADLRVLTARTQPLVVRAVDDAMRGRSAAARELMSREIVTAQKLIAIEINRLLEFQREEIERAVEQAAASFRWTWSLMLLLGASALGLGLAVAFFVLRHSARQAHLLQFQALNDHLTGLPNRTLFADRLQQAILIGRREKQPFALVALDLDGFKEINDTLGHHAGDQVLRAVAERVRASLRESDTIARMGGDEFDVLLPTVDHVEGAVASAEKIIEALREPIQIDGQSVEIRGSLGIALFPAHAEDAPALLRHADAAMYVAKRARGGFRLYEPAMDEQAGERALLPGDLRRGIAAGELVLHYQPKFDFGADHVTGVEALVRWQHPRFGLLYPDRFLPLAEESGLIRELTTSVLRMAMRQIEQWHAAGLDLTVAVNISALNVQDPGFPDEVARLLGEHRVPPSRIELELTETAVMTEPLRAVECIKRLNALGLQIAIDDFGTGYSSMAYLKELLVAKIKIDKTFVMDMLRSHNDSVIVRSTVELGHNLGLKVVAEGVENQRTWNQLRELGCDAAQGYFLSKPIEAGQFIEWLQNSPWREQLREAHADGVPDAAGDHPA